LLQLFIFTRDLNRSDMRKFIFLLVLAFMVNMGFAKRPLYKKHHIVNKTLSEILKYKDFKPAAFGFLAIDSKTGEIVAQYHPDKALRPASNLKLITTATALQLYGSDFRFETKLGYTGRLDTANHILYGNVIIKGGGDPTLGSKYFDETKTHRFLQDWADTLKNLGIDSVTGRVIADARVFSRDIVPLSWSWNNMGDYYGAGPCGLTIYDNYFTVYFDTDSTRGVTVTIDSVVPSVPGLVFDNGVISDTVSGDHSDILGAPYCNLRYLRGALPLGKKGFGVKGSLPDPAFVAACEMNRVLKENGIKCSGRPTTVHRLWLTGKKLPDSVKYVMSTFSPPLSKIIQQTNTHSINLFAEHMLDLSGFKLADTAQTETDAKAVMHYWDSLGMDIQGMALTDGSGLSQYDAVTPRQMVFVLRYMKHNSPYFEDYYQSLPLAGDSVRAGTLEGMFKGTPAENNLRAKSGTIDRVKSYTGFVTSRSGREIIFSTIVNGFSCKSREAKARLEKLMTALAELKK
jgi:D-alanyl-D-alanine carboxypeptidase/D-alanyl-D-alanine-endopeptidase (penicillin-binding protein 4)